MTPWHLLKRLAKGGHLLYDSKSRGRLKVLHGKEKDLEDLHVLLEYHNMASQQVVRNNGCT